MYAMCMVPSRGTFRALTWDEHRAAPGGCVVFRKIKRRGDRSTVYGIVNEDLEGRGAARGPSIPRDFYFK